jgi:hypothetical protein
MPKIKSVGVKGKSANSHSIQYIPGTALQAKGRKSRFINVYPDKATQVYADERNFILSQYDDIIEIKE